MLLPYTYAPPPLERRFVREENLTWPVPFGVSVRLVFVPNVLIES